MFDFIHLDSWVDYLMVGLLILCGAVLVGLIGWLLFQLWIYVAFKSHYGLVHTVEGRVTNMNYVAAYTTTTTTYVNNQPMIQTQYHPAQNQVYVSIPEKQLYYDSSTLYQRVRIGEKVTVVYQEEWLEPRFWTGKLKYDSIYTISVTSEKNEMVIFNEEKSVSKKLEGAI
jgi:hypothetical protein